MRRGSCSGYVQTMSFEFRNFGFSILSPNHCLRESEKQLVQVERPDRRLITGLLEVQCRT